MIIICKYIRGYWFLIHFLLQRFVLFYKIDYWIVLHTTLYLFLSTGEACMFNIIKKWHDKDNICWFFYWLDTFDHVFVIWSIFEKYRPSERTLFKIVRFFVIALAVFGDQICIIRNFSIFPYLLLLSSRHVPIGYAIVTPVPGSWDSCAVLIKKRP